MNGDPMVAYGSPLPRAFTDKADNRLRLSTVITGRPMMSGPEAC